MNYVCLTNNVVTDQTQIDPSLVFNYNYAAQFIEAPDYVTTGWSLVDGTWTPPEVTPQEIQQQNKANASYQLTATDWTSIPAVADPLRSNPYLTNQGEFDAYRSQLRAIAIDPPTTIIENWPILPNEVWSTT